MTTIAIIGATGPLGFGLALRWARAGREVIMGSRRLQAAEQARTALLERLPDAGGCVQAMENADAATAADLVMLAVPFAQQAQALDKIATELTGKILVDTSVPLVPPKVGRVQLPAQGCSGLAVQARVGTDVRVVSAFQNVAADKLQSLEPLDCDVLVCGDDRDAREQVIALVEAAGLRGFHAGPLANAVAAEALTSILITINRQFQCQSGIRIVGTGRDAP
ncbi:MAG: NADPH-dependent F420 reductase [Salinisphaera sp.]|nr:NADPH-dependent F420 reductase [Salinisphaera sp.]